MKTSLNKVETITSFLEDPKKRKIAAGLLAGAALGAVAVLVLSKNKNSKFKQKAGDLLCSLLENSKGSFASAGKLLKSKIAN